MGGKERSTLVDARFCVCMCVCVCVRACVCVKRQRQLLWHKKTAPDLSCWQTISQRNQTRHFYARHDCLKRLLRALMTFSVGENFFMRVLLQIFSFSMQPRLSKIWDTHGRNTKLHLSDSRDCERFCALFRVDPLAQVAEKKQPTKKTRERTKLCRIQREFLIRH